MPLYLLKFYFSHSIFAVSSDSSQKKAAKAIKNVHSANYWNHQRGGSCTLIEALQSKELFNYHWLAFYFYLSLSLSILESALIEEHAAAASSSRVAPSAPSTCAARLAVSAFTGAEQRRQRGQRRWLHG